ncbi:hypothetical protein AtEden1_Chr1g0043401 [Arabidopsis thaliana]
MKSFFKGLVQSRIESSGSESSSIASESYSPNLMDDLVSTPHNQLLPVELVDISDDDEDDSSSIVPVRNRQNSVPMSTEVPGVSSVTSRLAKRKRDTPSEEFLSQKQQKGKGVVVSGPRRSNLFQEFKFSSPLAEQRYLYFSRRQMIKELNLDPLADKWITDVISEAGLLNTTQHPDIQILKRTSASVSQGQSAGKKVASSTAPATPLGLRAAVQQAVTILQAALDAGYINGGMLEYQTQSKRGRLKM